jgi:hypothetical protein
MAMFHMQRRLGEHRAYVGFLSLLGGDLVGGDCVPICIVVFLFSSFRFLCPLSHVVSLLVCALFSPLPSRVLPMAPLHEHVEIVAFVSTLLVLFLNVQDALQQALGFHSLDAEEPNVLGKVETCEDMMFDLNLAAAASVHCYHLLNMQFFFF